MDSAVTWYATGPPAAAVNLVGKEGLSGSSVTLADGISLVPGGIVQDAFENLLRTHCKQDATACLCDRKGQIVYNDFGISIPALDPADPLNTCACAHSLTVNPMMKGACSASPPNLRLASTPVRPEQPEGPGSPKRGCPNDGDSWLTPGGCLR